MVFHSSALLTCSWLERIKHTPAYLHIKVLCLQMVMILQKDLLQVRAFRISETELYLPSAYELIHETRLNEIECQAPFALFFLHSETSREAAREYQKLPFALLHIQHAFSQQHASSFSRELPNKPRIWKKLICSDCKARAGSLWWLAFVQSYLLPSWFGLQYSLDIRGTLEENLAHSRTLH